MRCVLGFKAYSISRECWDCYFRHSLLVEYALKPSTELLAIKVPILHQLERAYISTLKQGVYLLKENELQQFYNNDLLLDAKIISIDKYKNKLLLTTSLKGCFFLFLF